MLLVEGVMKSSDEILHGYDMDRNIEWAEPSAVMWLFHLIIGCPQPYGSASQMKTAPSLHKNGALCC